MTLGPRWRNLPVSVVGGSTGSLRPCVYGSISRSGLTGKLAIAVHTSNVAIFARYYCDEFTNLLDIGLLERACAIRARS